MPAEPTHSSEELLPSPAGRETPAAASVRRHWHPGPADTPSLSTRPSQGVCSWKTGSGVRCHSRPGSLLEPSGTDSGVEVGIVVWSRGATCMIISRSFNREGIIKRRRSGNNGLRKEKESLLAYVPNNFLNYRPSET